ncbi:MAG: ATP synthase F0 subunit C [Nitrospinae bacterium]|nr:ATP synthase F0 subunit C [Nitrospinota bacterium]
MVLAAGDAMATEGAVAASGAAGAYGSIGMGSVIGLGLAAGGGGIGMGLAVNGALQAMSRNPGFYGRLFTNMMIGLALIEGAVLYVLVLALIFMYGMPWTF